MPSRPAINIVIVDIGKLCSRLAFGLLPSLAWSPSVPRVAFRLVGLSLMIMIIPASKRRGSTEVEVPVERWGRSNHRGATSC